VHLWTARSPGRNLRRHIPLDTNSLVSLTRRDFSAQALKAAALAKLRRPYRLFALLGWRRRIVVSRHAVFAEVIPGEFEFHERSPQDSTHLTGASRVTPCLAPPDGHFGFFTFHAK
jgi:hypothetical protein